MKVRTRPHPTLSHLPYTERLTCLPLCNTLLFTTQYQFITKFSYKLAVLPAVLVRQRIARRGVPDIITPGRESQFVSDLCLEICRWMGIARDPTTTYHPQLNGNVERMHRCLKNSLRASLLGRTNWLAELSWLMLGLHAAANIDTGVTPSMIVTGKQAALSGQLIVQ